MYKLMKYFVRTIIFLTLLFALIIAIFWAPDRSVEELKSKWAQSPSQFIDIFGMQVHLRDEGPRDDPNPIVLLHGTGASLHTWDGWVDELKKEHRVIRFDLPGFGLTGPAIDGNYSIERYANVVIALLNKLKVEKAIMGGNSLGGYVAWMTASLYPNRVNKLLLVDSSGYAFKSESTPIAFQIAQIPILNKIMKYVLPRFIVENSVRNVFGTPYLVTPELVDRYYDLATREGNRQALVERYEQTKPGPFANKITELQLPTLILWGELDHLIPVEYAHRFQKDIGGSELVVFKKSGHVPHEEHPLKTVHVFMQFLDI